MYEFSFDLMEWLSSPAISLAVLSVSIGAFCFRYQNRKKIWLDQARKVFSTVGSGTANANIVRVYNHSDYPVYDVIVLQCRNGKESFGGLHSIDAKHVLDTRYIGFILPGNIHEIEMTNQGKEMNQSGMAGIFFRDYAGKEWFRSSLGEIKRIKNYQSLLEKKGIMHITQGIM